MTRKIGSRLRFEVLKRDGFVCRYCGMTPVQEPLHVDHVIPVAEGGTDDPENLITSCRRCNVGKGAVPLEESTLTPTEEVESLRDQVEQIRAYLEAHKQVHQARTDAVKWFASLWESHVGIMSQDMGNRLPRLIRENPISLLSQALEITAQNLGSPGQEYLWERALSQQKYFHGVLRNLKSRSPVGVGDEDSGPEHYPGMPLGSASCDCRECVRHRITECAGGS